MTNGNQIKDTAETVKGIVEAVPVYQDVLQPAARQVGTALETVAKTIHIALAPISALVWGYDQIKDFISTKVAEKLRGVPDEKIQTPDATIAGPALEALKYTGHKEDLRELYANLLANAINVDEAKNPHPGFVDIIRNLTTDEARILRLLSPRSNYPIISTKGNLKTGGYRYLLQNVSLLGQEAGCQFPHYSPNYISNLCRLGLLRIPPLSRLMDDKLYDPIINHPDVQKGKRDVEARIELFSGFEVEKKYVELTEFGMQFARACIYPPKR